MPGSTTGSTPDWFAPTHRDHLVAHYGLDPAANPEVMCACGRAATADCMVDVTPLPAPVRAALGLASVDYLCDGCTTRLFRERHIRQEDFNRLLGAPPDNQQLARARDLEHAVGMQRRPLAHRPVWTPVDPTVATMPVAPGAAALPLATRSRSHVDSARALGLVRPAAAPAAIPAVIPTASANSDMAQSAGT